jgi:hypothetical protein
MGSPVRLSVVLVWRDPKEGIVEAVGSLADQVGAVGGELIVVTPLAHREIAAAQGCVAGPRWVRVEKSWSEPRAWEVGVREARGAVVAFGQARCRYAEGWAEAILDSAIGPDRAVAGPVLAAPGMSLADRAAFLCDYGLLSGSSGRGAAACNVAFERATLLPWCDGTGVAKADLLGRGGFRVEWHPAMAATIHPVQAARADRVMRYHRGRSYAARRAERWSPARRAVFGAGCLLLPTILLARLATTRERATLARGLPWIVAALAAWSAGELVGYWRGAGSSPRLA